MGGESERRGRCRLTLTINGMHFSVRPIQSEDDQIQRAFRLRRIPYGSVVILRQVSGGSRTWPGARAQAILMSVWRTCWQQGRCALDFLSQLLRGKPAALALPP
jgi:hypothetical protein